MARLLPLTMRSQATPGNRHALDLGDAKPRTMSTKLSRDYTWQMKPSSFTLGAVGVTQWAARLQPVCPELTQVPEEDVLGHEVPLLNEGLLNAGGGWQRVKVEVILAKLEPSAHRRFVRAAVRKAGRKDAVGQSGTVR